MEGDTTAKLSTRAYSKMILHAAKYPHCGVIGALIGANAGALQVRDAVPLFHQGHDLTPMVEVALAHVDAEANSAGMKIVGIYHANERFADIGVDVFTMKIAEKVSEFSSPSLLVTLDNRRLGVMMTSSALRVQITTESGKWRSLSEAEIEDKLVEEGAVEAVAPMIQKGLVEQLCDFDNHLDDSTKDFLNVELNMEIDQCL